jgi:hypothetical protein
VRLPETRMCSLYLRCRVASMCPYVHLHVHVWQCVAVMMHTLEEVSAFLEEDLMHVEASEQTGVDAGMTGTGTAGPSVTDEHAIAASGASTVDMPI